MKHKVIGLRVEKYLGTTCEGHNCDFEYGKEERERHVLLLKNVENSQLVELTLSYEEGECGSGWCTASFGEYEWNVVSSFAGKTHTINVETFIDISESVLEDCCESSVKNAVFDFSPDGGCGYYPSGYYEVDMNLFTPSSD
tara:strand:+ start:625 stop:1047 length:423 start_codon:yes stop_codon:yes gene_type:complete